MRQKIGYMNKRSGKGWRKFASLFLIHRVSYQLAITYTHAIYALLLVSVYIIGLLVLTNHNEC